MTYVIFEEKQLCYNDVGLRSIGYMKRIILIIIIAVGLIGSVTDYVFTKHDSYNRYLEGEYYFLYEAQTCVPGDPNYIITPDDPMFYADYSNPRNMLMISSLDVLVYNPHDGFCTVIYGDNVIEDFPLSHISISGEDLPYFNGTKQYTYEEYIGRLDSIPRKQISTTKTISDKHMADYRHIPPFTIIIGGIDALLLAIWFFFRNTDPDTVDILLLGGAGLNILFNIITWFAY
jgi:hypothetical protein